MEIEQPNYGANYLGSILGIEFPECNIAASALHVSVRELVSAQKDVSSIKLVDTLSNRDIKAHIVKIKGDFEIKEERFPVGLALIQQVEIKEKGGLLKKRKEANRIKTERNIDSIKLCALIEDAIYVPLATFVLRTGGECSYVQIGDEMTKDFLYTVPADDNTERFTTIKSIRTILKGETLSSKKEESVLLSLIERQTAKYKEGILREKEKIVVNSMYEKIRGENTQLKVSLENSKGEISNEIVRSREILPQFILNDGIHASLAILQPGTEDKEDIYLCAMVRSNIAIKIATLSMLDESIHLEELADGDFNRKESIDNIIFILRNVESIKESKLDKKSYDYYDRSTYDFIIHILIPIIQSELGLLSKEESLQLEEKIKKDEDPYRWREFQKNVKNYFYFQDIYKNKSNLTEYYINMKKYGDHIKSLLDKTGKDFFDQFRVKERIESLGGNSNKFYEDLIFLLFELSKKSTELKAHIKEVPMGKTEEDADIKGEISFSEGVYSLIVYAKPSSMETEPFRRVSRLDINILNPGENKNMDTDKLKAFIDLLGCMNP